MSRSYPLATECVVDARLVELETDPYPLYAWMRREQPIAWVPETERLWVTTWDLCAEAGAADDVFGPPRTSTSWSTAAERDGHDRRGASHGPGAARRRFRPRAVNEYVETLCGRPPRDTSMRFESAAARS